MQPVRPERQLHAGQRRKLVGPRAGCVDEPVRPDPAGRGGNSESCSCRIRLDLDRGHVCVHPDHRAGLGGAKREERCRARGVGMAFLRRRRWRRGGRRRGTGRTTAAPLPRARSRRGLPPPRSRSCRAAGGAPLRVSATISPPVMCRSSVAVELLLERLPHLAASAWSRTSVCSRSRTFAGLGAGELVDRDLEVEAARIRSRRLAVQLAPLDQHDLDSLLREVVGERRSGEAATDDEHVRARRQRPQQVAPRQPASGGARSGAAVRLSRHG